MHRLSFALAFGLGLIGVALTLGQPLVFKRIIDVDVPGEDMRGLALSALAYFGLMLGSGLAGLASTILLGKAGVMAVNAIKRTLFGHFFRAAACSGWSGCPWAPWSAASNPTPSGWSR